MTSFVEFLETRARQADSLLCVGLDPHPDDLPEATPEAACRFCLHLIEATAELAAAYKPNAAFFELYAGEGMDALRDVIAAVPAGIPVILDAKRGDIASSSQAYARAAFDTLGAHAITVNPYLGYDALQPFIERAERGAFLLCKTSNPGSADLQDLPVVSSEGWSSLYEHVARLARSWNTANNLGLVVGATHPEALAQARRVAPELWILSPGVGVQGGDLRTAIHAGLRPDGLGLLLPVSRSISRAGNPRQAADELRLEINRAREEVTSSPVHAHASPQSQFGGELATLADLLLKAGCVKFGSFTLKSGLQSPIYIDLRRLVATPALLTRVAASYLPILKRLHFSQLAALPYAAIPIATAISLEGGWPLLYPRKEAKTYGTRAEIEGVFSPGEQVVVIDDLATTGESKLEALQKLTEADMRVSDVVVLIDRQSGAAQSLAEVGIRFHAVFTLTQLLDYWEANQRVPAEQIAAARAFIAATGPG